MALTIDQLHNGICYWRLEKFPPDFHNTYYERDLVAVRANGVFNQQWWSRFLPVLQDWQAIRPCSHASLTSRAQARFEALSKTWTAVVASAQFLHAVQELDVAIQPNRPVHKS